MLFMLIALVLKAQSSDSIAVLFEHDSYRLIRTNLQSLEGIPDKSKVVIEGYTDTSGAESYNEQLAMKRILSVKRMISLPDSMVETKVIGETTKFGSDEQNRRVLIIKSNSLDTLVLGIEFENREAIILEKSYPELRQLIEMVKSGSYSRIEVHGHVCCNGNYQLSLERAKTVERKLIESGIDPKTIICFGHSNTEPRYPEINPENEAKNRRVEVVLID